MDNNKDLTKLYFDNEFRNAIRKNSRQTLNNFNAKLADDIEVKVHTNDKSITYVVIPNLSLDKDGKLDLQNINAAVSTLGSIGTFGSIFTVSTIGGCAGTAGTAGTIGCAGTAN